MKKGLTITLIVAACLVGLGVLVLGTVYAFVGGDLSRLTIEQYWAIGGQERVDPVGGNFDRYESKLGPGRVGEAQPMAYESGEIESLNVYAISEGIQVECAEDDRLLIVCRDVTDTDYYTFTRNGSTLTVMRRVKGQSVNHHAPITVYLPENYGGALRLNATSGSIAVGSGFSLSSLNATSTSGDVAVAGGFAMESLNVSSTSGRLDIGGDMKLDTLDVSTTSGRIEIGGNTELDTLDANSASGSIRIGAVTADRLEAGSTSGSIHLDGVDAQRIRLSSTSGSISGTLAGPMEAYAIDWQTSGRCDLPKQTGGTRSLSVSATSGSIRLSFAE